MQGVFRNHVRLLPHDKAWDAEFLAVKARIEAIWGADVLDVHHIGSTAIRQICAKPILDVAVVLCSLEEMDVAALERAGYEYRGPQDPEKTHRLFVLRGENQLSLHHIHCYEPGAENLRLCLGFRDYLNSHPEDAKRYEALKLELARRFGEDRNAYAKAKEDFILSINAKL